MQSCIEGAVYDALSQLLSQEDILWVFVHVYDMILQPPIVSFKWIIPFSISELDVYQYVYVYGEDNLW
jgi:hypothetical protein